MQQEYIGRGKITSLELELNKFKPKKILLVTGKKSFTNCGAQEIVSPFLKDYKYLQFNDFAPNPTYQDALKGVALCKEQAIDMIIAIGGGSCIDIAKSINALYSHPGEELSLIKGDTEIFNDLAPLIAIPTTAGTGSEATHFSVIYLEGKKYSLASSKLLPNSAIIDPVFTDTLPPYITASTGFDALCQSIEACWSKSTTNESKDYARQAIPLIIDNLIDAIKLGTRQSREKLMIAANLSGKAINISKTTAPHALSYELASRYNLSHGHSVALTLGSFLILHNNLIDQQANTEYLADAMDELFILLRVKNAQQAYHFWYKLMRDCGLEINITEIGLDDEGIQKVISEINLERLNNHPIYLSQNSLNSIFDILRTTALTNNLS